MSMSSNGRVIGVYGASRPRNTTALASSYLRSAASRLYRDVNHTLSLVHTGQLRVNGRVMCDRSISRRSPQLLQ